MTKKSYLEEVDQALLSIAGNNKSREVPDRIAFSEESVTNGCFKKVAFDVYRVDNDPYETLWILQDFDDGQHLVRASIPEYSQEVHGEWCAVSDGERKNITLKYKNIPIARFSSDEFNFKPDEALTFKSAILDRAEKDDDFLKDIFKSQPSSKREALVSTFPEFKKFI